MICHAPSLTVCPTACETTLGTAAGVGEDVERALARRVTDYLAGMTDRYCIREYTELQVPKAFAR